MAMARSRTVACTVVAGLALTGIIATGAHAATGTTAWRDGSFSVNVPNLVRRSDVVLRAPNAKPEQAMPLGNGVLGAAVWSAGGFTAQLNRSDTQPLRLSPGWLTIPGLAKLTGAADFSAHLDLFDATLIESGGGMTATVYLRADKDEIVVDVTGAAPNTTQTARIALWSGRSPKAQTSGHVGVLAADLVRDLAPEARGGEDVRLVDGGELAPALAGERERGAEEACDLGLRVDERVDGLAAGGRRYRPVSPPIATVPSGSSRSRRTGPVATRRVPRPRCSVRTPPPPRCAAGT